MTTFDLERFVTAQDDAYPRAFADLREGHKRSHWLWFVFPQIAGLGHSPMARFYAIASIAEARAYLAHPVLGPRLDTCTRAMLAHKGQRAEAILGGIDALKFRSSLTLFEAVADDPALFAAALDAFYEGGRDARTLELLGR